MCSRNDCKANPALVNGNYDPGETKVAHRKNRLFLRLKLVLQFKIENERADRFVAAAIEFHLVRFADRNFF